MPVSLSPADDSQWREGRRSYYERDFAKIVKAIRAARWVYVTTSFGENVQISKRVAIDLLKRDGLPKLLASIHPGHHVSGVHVFIHKDTGEEV